jgi:multimeric flavodoxin WrbA
MKVLMINGSPHAAGSTYTALCEMEKIFVENGFETEIVRVGHLAVRGWSPASRATKRADAR